MSLLRRGLAALLPFLAALPALLSSCGGSVDVTVNVGGAGTGPAALSVAVTGLPAGTAGDLTVTGPGGFRTTAAGSTTLPNLSPGTYTISAGGVLTGTTALTPLPPTQQIIVTGGATASVTVAYGNALPFRLVLSEVASGLAAPVHLTAPPGDPRLFVVERAGRVRILQDGSLLPTPFLDISALTTTDGERGLLSIAFDPAYASNGRFFVYYTDLAGDIAIARYQVSATDPNAADPAGSVLLSIPHPTFNNHNGGQLAFGPDGMLFIGTGDGGGAGDPGGNAQNLNVLLGKLLRIDVRNGGPYAIPPDNPFVGQASRRAEIWARGLRNPWRFSFDGSGSLYIGDVGQDQREEVDVAGAAAGGLNYGWNLLEGTLCFLASPCAIPGLTPPVLEYAHDASGGCAIVGGFVYRGSATPALRGRYLYSDLCSGFLRSFALRDGAAAELLDWKIASPGSVLSFGEDAQHEVYLLADPFTSATSGKIYRVTATAAQP